jgi:hypothetical protein
MTRGRAQRRAAELRLADGIEREAYGQPRLVPYGRKGGMAEIGHLPELDTPPWIRGVVGPVGGAKADQAPAPAFAAESTAFRREDKIDLRNAPLSMEMLAASWRGRGE